MVSITAATYTTVSSPVIMYVIFTPVMMYFLFADYGGTVPGTLRRSTNPQAAEPKEPALPIQQPVVRAAVPADIEQIAAICAHYVTTSLATFEEVPPTAADWQRRLDDLAGRNLPFLVAEADALPGSVGGYAYASPWRPKPAYRHTVEDTVYVSPAHTGRGLGAALLGALLTDCERAGARQVIAVIADADTDASAALHRRFGFRQAGRLSGVGRKHGRWIDTVLMQRELGPGR
jgi:L-amino acid N-acyltransferase YncA